MDMYTIKAGRRRSVLGLILLVITLQFSAAQDHTLRMATVGNSITYGAGLSSPSTECYPAQLSGMLAEIYGDSIEIGNFSVSGRNMLKNAPNPIWVEPEFRNALRFVPDICLILLGTNDCKPYLWDDLAGEMIPDYLSMIDTFQYRNPDTKFIVCYPPPIWEGHPYGTSFEDFHNDSIVVNHLIPKLDTIVAETGAILVDFHTPFVDSVHLFPDKLHPGLEGSRQMAEIVYNKLIETDLVHQVEAGRAFASYFEQSKVRIANGKIMDINWATINADSVFLNGELVENAGSLEIVAQDGEEYTLQVKNDINSITYTLVVNAYTQLKSGIKITPSTYSLQNSVEAMLYCEYTDQFNLVMDENTSNITWTVTEGEGSFGAQTDTSIVFIPGSTAQVTVEASEGEISGDKTFRVNTELAVPESLRAELIRVFPNPTSDQLHFELVSMENSPKEISIFSLAGKLLKKEVFATSGTGKQQLNLSITDLNPGTYLYSISYDSKASLGKFIVE